MRRAAPATAPATTDQVDDAEAAAPDVAGFTTTTAGPVEPAGKWDLSIFYLETYTKVCMSLCMHRSSEKSGQERTSSWQGGGGCRAGGGLDQGDGGGQAGAVRSLDLSQVISPVQT